MKTQQVDYQQVLHLANQLPISEQVELILTLRDKLLGFGMWKSIFDANEELRHKLREVKEMKDVETYVEDLRTAESRHPNGHLKSPEEFLKELEEWNE